MPPVLIEHISDNPLESLKRSRTDALEAKVAALEAELREFKDIVHIMARAMDRTMDRTMTEEELEVSQAYWQKFRAQKERAVAAQVLVDPNTPRSVWDHINDE